MVIAIVALVLLIVFAIILAKLAQIGAKIISISLISIIAIGKEIRYVVASIGNYILTNENITPEELRTYKTELIKEYNQTKKTNR